MDTLTVYLVRHLRTIDNIERRYSHDSDVPLIDPPESTPLPHSIPATRIVSSPARRAQITASRWFGDRPIVTDHDLREMHFGRFAGCTADELKNDADYRQWVDSGCLITIPGGDNLSDFTKRVAWAFLHHLSDRVVFVTHAGPIMAILHQFAAIPYFSFYVKTGQIVRLRWSTKTQIITDVEVLQ